MRAAATTIAAATILVACAAGDPETVCDETQFTPPSSLTCQAAVAVATDALPDDHPPIDRITFRYGNYCPPGWECPMTSPEFGVVFFEFIRGHDWYVEVVATFEGVEVRSGPAPGSP